MPQPRNSRARKTAKRGPSARTQGADIENVTPPLEVISQNKIYRNEIAT